MTTNETTLEVEQLYRKYKPLLTSIAYRMLGSLSEAEDAVHDVFVTVSKLDERNSILYPKAYLVKMVTNRVLNVMKSAPRKRESYPGQWLPEPVIELDPEVEPLERIVRHEQLGYAMLVLLQTCTPPERLCSCCGSRSATITPTSPPCWINRKRTVAKSIAAPPRRSVIGLPRRTKLRSTLRSSDSSNPSPRPLTQAD